MRLSQRDARGIRRGRRLCLKIFDSVAVHDHADFVVFLFVFYAGHIGCRSRLAPRTRALRSAGAPATGKELQEACGRAAQCRRKLIITEVNPPSSLAKRYPAQRDAILGIEGTLRVCTPDTCV